MAYPFQNYQQPFSYQDQLNQLRGAPMAMPGPSYQINMPQYKTDNSGVLWVQGEAGAKSWFVNPGNTVLLMDSEAQRFYLKSADMNGVPAMRIFEYTEVAADRHQSNQEPAQFVTIEEFAGFKNDVFGRLDDLAATRKKKGEANESPV